MSTGLLELDDKLSKHVPEWIDEHVTVYVSGGDVAAGGTGGPIVRCASTGVASLV